jgi:GTPase
MIIRFSLQKKKKKRKGMVINTRSGSQASRQRRFQAKPIVQHNPTTEV